MTDTTPFLEALEREFERRLAPIRLELAALREEVATLRTRDLPQHLTVAEACREFGLSRSKFYLLLADFTTGLNEVVFRPPGTRRTLVVTSLMKAWVDARGRPERSSQDDGAGRRHPAPGPLVAPSPKGGRR